MTPWLLDTGPLVAYLDARDPYHAAVTVGLEAFAGKLHTTSAVVTEAMHFVTASRRGPRLLAELMSMADVVVHDFAQPVDLEHAAVLMEKYSDTPMDYADATLVLLGERFEIFDIATLDRRGFNVFRTSQGHYFRQVLDLG